MRAGFVDMLSRHRCCIAPRIALSSTGSRPLVSIAVEAMTFEARHMNDAHRGALPRVLGADVYSVCIPGMRQENESEASRNAFESSQPTLCAISPEVGTLSYPCGNGCEAVASLERRCRGFKWRLQMAC